MDITQVSVGDVIGEQTVSFDRARLIRYAGASGDFNVIHWNERVAREVDLPGVIAHGMLTMGAAIEVVAAWIGDPGNIVSYSTRFSKMVPVPDPGTAEVRVVGTVKAIDTKERTVTIDLAVTFEDEKVLARTEAVVRV